MPIELVGKEGVIKRVSGGHDLKEAPTVERSSMRKSSIPAWRSVAPTPTPAAPAPTITASCSDVVETEFFTMLSLTP